MDGQAESAPESGGLADLVSFLEDTPETESEEQESETQNESDATGEADTAEDQNNGQEEESETSEEESEEEPATVDKVTFKVKGDDGSEQTVEATTEEIAASWMRQQDYTRKTQALAERENEAVQFLTKKHEEVRSQYLAQAELARAAVVQMAGLRTEEEMAQLAQSDPSAWVAESQRQRQISAFISGLNQQIEAERQQSQAMQEQQLSMQRQQQGRQAWQELSKAGIDQPKLAKIYSDVNKSYGFTSQELETVYDHRMVKVMADAVAYRELMAKKPKVMQKAQQAVRIPQTQAQPAQERRSRETEMKFRSGRAKLNDLVAIL
jgi:hypothetical protein